MIRSIFVLLTLCIVSAVSAADTPFSDYQAYETFVNDSIMKRSFPQMILRLGGADEYTQERISATNAQLLAAMPFDFDQSELLLQNNLNNSFSQEVRAYWIADGPYQYAFFYALLHHREDGILVLVWNLNTQASPILEMVQ